MRLLSEFSQVGITVLGVLLLWEYEVVVAGLHGPLSGNALRFLVRLVHLLLVGVLSLCVGAFCFGCIFDAALNLCV